MSLRDLQARVKIVNFLNAAQNIDRYYIDLDTLYQIRKRSLARYTHKDQHIPDSEIAAEIHDLRDTIGDLIGQSKDALDQLKCMDIKDGGRK